MSDRETPPLRDATDVDREVAAIIDAALRAAGYRVSRPRPDEPPLLHASAKVCALVTEIAEHVSRALTAARASSPPSPALVEAARNLIARVDRAKAMGLVTVQILGDIDSHIAALEAALPKE